MTDKEYIMDALEMEKNFTVDMAFALNEASNEDLYKDFFEIFKETSKAAKELFYLAYDLGFYTLEKESQTKLKNTLKTFNQEMQMLEEE